MFTVTSGYSLLNPSTKRPSSSPEDQTSNVPLRAVSVCETDADVGALEPEGVLAGALQGYYGGKVDLWGQRFIEVWSGMPTLFLIILLSSVVQPNFWWLLAITVLFGWMSLVGVVRAEFLRTRNFDYIRAAQALGVSDRSIILRHMLPNAMVATLTFLPFILCSSITTLTSLDFLGFGLPLGSPSLGELLLQGKNNLQAPWLGITAFLSVAILLSLLIFIGEAVRDAFDPNKAV